MRFKVGLENGLIMPHNVYVDVKLKKKERLISLLHEAASSFIRFEADPNAMVTVIRTELSDNGQSAKFYISVFPDEKEKEILDFLRKRVKNFKNFMKPKIKMKFLPDVSFEIDKTWR